MRIIAFLLASLVLAGPALAQSRLQGQRLGDGTTGSADNLTLTPNGATTARPLKERARDVGYSVLDFGPSVGTGGDDSAAINAASWKQQDGYSPVGFRKGRDGKVYLRGNLLNSTAALDTSAFTLPAGYRPGSQRTFVTANSGTSLSRVSINGDGQVVINSASGAGTGGDPYQAGLDGISFEPGV